MGKRAVGRVPDAPGVADDGGGINRRVRRGLGWSFLNNVVSRAGGTLAGIVIARLLAPEDFGTFAVALVTLNAVMNINDLGVSLAIVRGQRPPEKILPTVTTLAITGSTLLYAVAFVAAPFVASAMHSPGATGVLRVLCLNIVVDAFTSVPAAMLTRRFMQGARMVVDLLSFAVGTAITIGLAVAGFGPWSLALGQLAGNLAAAAVIYQVAGIRLCAGFDREEAAELLRFGLPLAGAGLLGFAVLNVDYVIVGRVLGPTALGLYLLAFNLSAWPVNMFSTAVHRVSVAGFSRMLGDPDALHRSLARSMTLLMAVTLPAGALLALLAHPLVGFVYGAKWTPAAHALQFLAIAAVVRVAIGLMYDFLIAAGRPGSNLRLQAVWLLALGPGLVIGTRADGIRGAGVASAVVAAAVVLPAALLALARAGASPWRVLAGLGRPAAGCALLVAVGVAVLAAVDGNVLELAGAGSLAALAYVAVTFPLRHLVRGAADPAAGDLSGPDGPRRPAEPRHRHRRRRRPQAVRVGLLRAARRPAPLPEPTPPR